MNIISTIKYIVKNYKNINFGYRENFRKFLTILDSTFSKIRDGYSDQDIERYLAAVVWPDAEPQTLASDSLEYAVRDWCQYYQVPLWDIKENQAVLDLTLEQEYDFLRILRLKRPGQINHFSNVKFYLKYINQVGFGRSPFFWAYLEEEILGDRWTPGVSFGEAFRKIKRIQALNLGQGGIYRCSEFKQLIDLSFRHPWIPKLCKELSVSSWDEDKIPELCKDIEEALKGSETYNAFLWKYYSIDQSFTNALYNYTSGMSAHFNPSSSESERIFCEQNMDNLRRMKREKLSPSSLKWVGINCPYDYTYIAKLLTEDGCYHETTLSVDTMIAIGRSIISKPGYYEEMLSFPSGYVRSQVLKGKLSEELGKICKGLKCSKKEALEHFKKGNYKAYHFMDYDTFHALPYEMRNSDNWVVYHWWRSKKDSAAWDRERVTYGPEGREFHFKFRSLLDEIRPEDLINGEKTSPDKVIEHACQRRQETIESALGCDWSPLPECELKGNDEFKQLMTPAELVDAGKYFHNCVGGYANACKAGRCFIFTSKDICAEINFSNNVWSVRQCLSFHNSYPDPVYKNHFDYWFHTAVNNWKEEQKEKLFKSLAAA